ncbi:MAG: trypsin-like peptidase domain-containing protein, partial [Alphaproteobacteria bacterium]
MNFRFVLTALFVGGSAVGLPLTAPAQSIYDAENGRAVPESAAQIQLSFAPLVKETAPAVVNIFTRAEITRSPLGVLGDEFFNSPFGSQSEKVQTALGSGVILTAEGLVVTNDHVIRDGTEIEVELTDGREFNAEVLFTDRAADLALLQIDPGEGTLPSLQLGNSDNVEIGDLVLAIGNPFGVGQTTTMGIVSALARTGTGVTEVGSFIQTDAAINPGNSGGALIDMKGQVIGINTAIFSSSGASAGIGFAIPANFVANTVRALEEGGGTVVRPWLGVTGETVTERMAKVLK